MHQHFLSERHSWESESPTGNLSRWEAQLFMCHEYPCGHAIHNFYGVCVVFVEINVETYILGHSTNHMPALCYVNYVLCGYWNAVICKLGIFICNMCSSIMQEEGSSLIQYFCILSLFIFNVTVNYNLLAFAKFALCGVILLQQKLHSKLFCDFISVSCDFLCIFCYLFQYEVLYVMVFSETSLLFEFILVCSVIRHGIYRNILLFGVVRRFSYSPTPLLVVNLYIIV